MKDKDLVLFVKDYAKKQAKISFLANICQLAILI